MTSAETTGTAAAIRPSRGSRSTKRRAYRTSSPMRAEHPGEPHRERQDQDEAVPDAVQGDGAQQQHHGRGAGDHPGRGPDGQQVAHREVLGRRVGVPARAVMVVVVVFPAAGRLRLVMAMVMVVVMAGLVDVPGRGRDAGQDRLAHVGVAALGGGGAVIVVQAQPRWARAWARSRRRRR